MPGDADLRRPSVQCKEHTVFAVSGGPLIIIPPMTQALPTSAWLRTAQLCDPRLMSHIKAQGLWLSSLDGHCVDGHPYLTGVLIACDATTAHPYPTGSSGMHRAGAQCSIAMSLRSWCIIPFLDQPAQVYQGPNQMQKPDNPAWPPEYPHLPLTACHQQSPG